MMEAQLHLLVGCSKGSLPVLLKFMDMFVSVGQKLCSDILKYCFECLVKWSNSFSSGCLSYMGADERLKSC